jgi:hypothetical protein
VRAAAGLIAAAALAAPPAASAAWSPPDTLSSARTTISGPRAGIGRDGRALALWTWTDGTRTGTSVASRAAGAAAFGAERTLARGPIADQRTPFLTGPAVYGPRRAIVAATGFTARTGRRMAIGVRFGTTAGRFGALRRLRTARGIRGTALAVNGSGDAVLAWFEDRGVRTDRVYVSPRRRGGRFGTPRRLATGRIRSVAAAVGPSGDVVVAWSERRRLRARFRPRGLRSFLPAQTIRSAAAANAEIEAAVNAGGRAVLAWSAQRASEGGERDPVSFQGAVKPAGSRRFAAAQTLERMASEGGLGRPIEVVADGTGGIVAAWSGSDGLNRRVRSAFADRSGRFTAPQDVSAPLADALLSDLAADPAGGVTAVWDGGIEDRASVVRAALAPTAVQPFGPPEAVSAAGRASRDGRAAYDPRTHRPAIVFGSRAARAFAQASTRSP